jgi:putative protease
MEKLNMAVRCGADAVYLAGTSFGMRSFAGNFTPEELPAAVKLAHDHGVRVHVTVNTMARGPELERLPAHLELLNDCGADALIVADLGAFRMAQKYAPRCELHVSTQVSVANHASASAWHELGAKRVVLARELSLEEIAEIRAKTPSSLEIEVFAHGAMCVSYSGRCLLSNYMTGRDSNRGACAQPCRLPYAVNGSRRCTHPLSLKDANLSGYLAELEDLGVACLKIEGRMKRPEYVAVITAIYRRLLDEKRGPTAEESAALEAAFSRSGFTDGYFRGEKGPHMLGTRPENARWPEELFAAARERYERGENRPVPVSLRCVVRAGEKAQLTASVQRGGQIFSAAVSGPIPETARNRSLTADELRSRLGKTGGTAFRADAMEIDLEGGLMLSAGAVNALRRQALEELAAQLSARPVRGPWPRRTAAETPLPPCPAGPAEPKLTCSVTRADQLTPELAAGADAVYVPLELLEAVNPEIYAGKTELFAVLPRIFRTEDEEKFREILRKFPVLRGVLAGNLGHLPIAEGLGLEIRGDFGLNVFNSRSLLFLKDLGLDSATVSFELRHQQVRDLNKYLPCEAIVYGRLPLMVTENCAAANTTGCTRGAGSVLTDRTGAEFPALCAYGCRNEIQNSKPLFLADRPDYRRSGLAYARLRFTTESAEECLAVLRRYRGETNWVPADYTRGLFYRGVE